MDNRRYYGLDALRGTMMMLGIILHGATLYLAAPPPHFPVPADPNKSYVFDLVFHFIHSFRMPTFFVLAGFFASLLVEKRGVWETYKNRAARIVAPLLASAVTILPLTMLFMVDFMLSVRFGASGLLPDLERTRIMGEEMRAAGYPVDEPAIGHLWFLYYLCYFYLLIPVCRFLVQRSLAIEASVKRFLASPVSLLFFGLYTAATLWPFRGGQLFEGFVFLKPHVPSLVYYGSFFIFGYVFHFYREVLVTCTRCAPWCAVLAAILFPLTLYLGHIENYAVEPPMAIHLASVIVNSFCTWALIYTFIGGVLRFFDRESPWTLYASQSSYWVFLIHMPAVCLAAWLLVPYDVSAIVKFLVVVTFTTVVCFVTYHYWVQGTWVSRFLNGRRFDLDWPWRARKDEAKVAVDA